MVLEYYVEGRIAYFVMNRPEKHNAITPEMMRLFEDTLIDFMENPGLRVGIITGMGIKSFCAGADIVQWLPFVKETGDKPWKMPRTMLRGMEVTKPLIAAVNGNAFGGGGEIALACDIRIASENTVFAWPESSLGILPRLGGTQRLPRIINKAKALEILITGKRLTAIEALEIGLVSKVVKSEDLMGEAKAIAEKICDMAPLSVQAIKKCVNLGCDMTLEDGLELENRLGLSLYNTKDYEEGRNAFKEKRRPEFKGE